MSRNHRYSGLAKGRAWELARQAALERDGRRCRRCSKAGRLEIHHIIPLSQNGTNDLENLETLCRGCHIEAHRPKSHEREKAWLPLIFETR